MRFSGTRPLPSTAFGQRCRPGTPAAMSAPWPTRSEPAVPLVQVPADARWGFPGVLGFCPGRRLAGKDGPDHGRAGVCPGPAISRRVRTGHAGRCAGLVGVVRAARGLREPAADARHVSRRERTRAVRPPGRASSAGRFARARAIHPGVRQPRAVARRSHPRPGRRAPAPGRARRIFRSGPRSWSTASSPAPGRSNGRKTPPPWSSNRSVRFPERSLPSSRRKAIACSPSPMTTRRCGTCGSPGA